MASPLLQVSRDDFFELNKTLEENVKSLMTELDSMISNQENVIEEPRYWSDKWNGDNDERPFSGFGDYDNFNELAKYVPKPEDDYDGRSLHATNKTIIRYLKAQVVKFQADLKAAQYELKKKSDNCKDLEVRIKKYEERRENFHNQLSAQKEIAAKAQALNNELQSKIQALSAEIASLKKEIEAHKRDLKSSSQTVANGEVRLARSLEENEKLRLALKNCQAEGKELREQVRKIQEEKRLALKTAEKQRAEIFQAFKKQTQLVDNLKKQKTYLEASKEIRLIEDDFVKLLNWKPDSTAS